ncbi:MAG: CbbQ/NirQ/NorQ domain-containing protein [Leptospirales bacterium]
MEKWLTATAGVFGYFGLVLLYILVVYSLMTSRPAIQVLFGFISLSILAGMIAEALGWMSKYQVIRLELILTGGAVFLTGLFLVARRKKSPPAGRDSPAIPSSLPHGVFPDTPVLTENGMNVGRSEAEERLPEEYSSLQSIFQDGFSVLLYGPTGSGKTFGVVMDHLKTLERRGERDGIVLIPCSDGMEDYDLLSKPIPIGPHEKIRILEELGVEFPEIPESALSRLIGDWNRVEGPLRAAFRRAAAGERIAVVFDELNRASNSARNLILKAIDPVLGHYELHDFTDGEIFRVPLSSLQFSATCNLGGAYSQTQELDESLLDRFQAVQFMDYNTRLEKQILLKEGLTPEKADQLIDVAVALREAYKMGHLSAPLSTRHLKNWGRAIFHGGDPAGVARSLWVDRLIAHDRHGFPDDEQVRAILDVLGMTFRSGNGSGKKNGTQSPVRPEASPRSHSPT